MARSKRIRLSTDEVLAAAPQDENIDPTPGGFIFEMNPDAPFKVDRPAYRDPSHVAAWYIGYMAALSAIAPTLAPIQTLTEEDFK